MINLKLGFVVYVRLQSQNIKKQLMHGKAHHNNVIPSEYLWNKP